MKFNPDIHHRQSIRLKGYDYSKAGAYFITVCTQNRACLFGEIKNREMALNDAGWVVQAVWDNLPNHYPHIALDECIVMPNHMHGIIVIVGAGLKPAPTMHPDGVDLDNGLGLDNGAGAIKWHGLPEIVRALKTFSARRINQRRQAPGAKLWQRNYYEHIIRNENELNRIREYIVSNPKKWEFDRENPDVSILETSVAQYEGQS